MKTQYLKMLERYFNQEMEPGEKIEFERMMENDAELRSAFREYQLILESLGDHDMLDFRAKLREIRDENYRKRIGGFFLNQNFNWMWLAALLVVIICLTVVATMLIYRMEFAAPSLAVNAEHQLPDASLLEMELNRFTPRNLNFTLESPKDSSIIDYPGYLLFSWKVDSVSALNFELIGSDGTIVFDSRSPVRSPYLFEGVVDEGLYVFRFRHGRFSIFHGLIYLR